MYVNRDYIRAAAGAALVIGLCFLLIAVTTGLSTHHILAFSALVSALCGAVGMAYTARRTHISVVAAYVGTIFGTIATVVFWRG